jgi:hypothetical protein
MVNPADQEAWTCARCDVALVISKVSISYLGSAYPVELPKCPNCGLIYIPEDLALGRMAEVEKALEDK